MNASAALIERNISYTQQIWALRPAIEQRLHQLGAEAKTTEQVLFDLLTWIWKHNAFDYAIYRHWDTVPDVVKNYFEIGVYKADRDANEFVSQGEWIHAMFQIQKKCKKSIRTLNHKDLFVPFAVQHGIPVPRRWGFLAQENGELVVLNESENALLKTLVKEHSGVFCKPVLDQCGNGAYKLLPAEDENMVLVNNKLTTYQDFAAMTAATKYLVETIVTNHDTIANIHPWSLNTCRMVTIQTPNGAFELLWAALRVGCNHSSVDNWHAGGAAIEISPSGTLGKYDGRNRFQHPTTHVIYEGLQLPYWKESVNLVKKAHSYFPDMKGIGWDVAITPAGPIIIEGNVWFDCAIMQSFGQGFRDFFNKELLPYT